MPALAPVESSELDIAPGLPGEVGVDGDVGSTVVGITEVGDEVTIGGEDDDEIEVVMEIVKLVGVALPSVCVVMVEISVVVMTMELRVAEEIVTVVGGSTETTVVVTDEGGSVDFEESDGFFLPPSSLLSSEQIRLQNLSSKDFEKTYCSCCYHHLRRFPFLCHRLALRRCHLFCRRCACFHYRRCPFCCPYRLEVQLQESHRGYRPSPYDTAGHPVGLSFVPSNRVTSPSRL